MAVPYVMIDLDGTPRPLRFEGDAQYKFEKRYGKSLVAVCIGFYRANEREREEIMMSSVLIVDLLWAGLSWHDRTLTPDRIIELLDTYVRRGGNIFELWPIMLEGVQTSGIFQSLGKQAEREGNGQAEPEPKSPTQDHSGSAIG